MSIKSRLEYLENSQSRENYNLQSQLDDFKDAVIEYLKVEEIKVSNGMGGWKTKLTK